MTEQAKELAPYLQVIQAVEHKFNDVNSFGLVWKKEAGFARQALENNDYLMTTASNNQRSLANAITNIGAIGLSLNPAEKLAYLVPRQKQICLDISYIGLIKLATDTGSIMWARAELIHENDDFTYHGATEKPEFATKNPFNRGAIVGVYCVAKTAEGDYLSGIMSIDEVYEIRNRSESYKAGSSFSPWNTFEGEMIKKTIIKRESKTWPKTDKTDRFDNAVEIINEHEGIDFSKQVDDTPINWQNVEQGYIKAIEIVDTDDFEVGSPMAHALMDDLSPDEQIAVNNKLKGYKPGKRQYNTLFREYLDYQPDEPMLPAHVVE